MSTSFRRYGVRIRTIALAIATSLAAGCNDRPVAPTAPPDTPPTRSARFEEVAVWNGSIPHREPWSPRGAKLLLNADDGLYVFDALEWNRRECDYPLTPEALIRCWAAPRSSRRRSRA